MRTVKLSSTKNSTMWVKSVTLPKQFHDVPRSPTLSHFPSGVFSRWCIDGDCFTLQLQSSLHQAQGGSAGRKAGAFSWVLVKPWRPVRAGKPVQGVWKELGRGGMEKGMS